MMLRVWRGCISGGRSCIDDRALQPAVEACDPLWLVVSPICSSAAQTGALHKANGWCATRVTACVTRCIVLMLMPVTDPAVQSSRALSCAQGQAVKEGVVNACIRRMSLIGNQRRSQSATET